MARNLEKTREMINRTEVVWNATKKEIAGCITDNSEIDPDLIRLLNGCNMALEAAMDMALEQAETLDEMTDRLCKLEYLLGNVLRTAEGAEKTLNRLTEAVNKK